MTERKVDRTRYDMRHECQEIIPGLLLGPFIVSKSLDTLKGLGITHMYVLTVQSCRVLGPSVSVAPRGRHLDNNAD